MQFRTIALMSAALLIAGCDRAATGQVVAIVNGEEISLNELNAELKSLGPTAGNRDAIRAQALQTLVDRKLLVQAARERGIDKDPDFLQQQRRAEDQLLVTLYAQQVTKNVPVPSQSEIDAFLRQNPQLGEGRVVYALDQIRLPDPSDNKFVQQLQPTKSMADVVALLGRNRMRYETQKASLDSSTTPKAMLDQIAKLQPGEPFIVRSGGLMIISAVTGQSSAPVASPEARRLAAETLRQNAIAEIARKQVSDARARAEIEYQEGFKPKT